MDYNEALQFIQKSGKFGTKLGLANIKALMDELKNVQNELKFIHVAGTNGKGSTSLFVSEILKSAGYRVGLYASPFIYEFNERIKINGENIDDKSFARIMSKVSSAIDSLVQKGKEHPTEFEIITACAFLYFYEKKCDVVVLEVGLGGRFDATNIIETPVLSIITKIGIDHSEYLGNTLSSVAFEKCGIIKKNVPVLSSAEQKDEALRVIKEKSKANLSPLTISNKESLVVKSCDISGSHFLYKDNEYSLKQIGYYQIFNAITAIDASFILKNLGFNIKEENIKNGLAGAVWLGRMEIIRKNPYFILDGSHNADGIDAFVDTAKKVFGGRKIICIFSMLKDKDYNYALSRLSEITDDLIITEINSPRRASIQELFASADGKFTNIYEARDNLSAVKTSLSLATGDDIIVSIGSLYMLSDIKASADRLK